VITGTVENFQIISKKRDLAMFYGINEIIHIDEKEGRSEYASLGNTTSYWDRRREGVM